MQEGLGFPEAVCLDECEIAGPPALFVAQQAKEGNPVRLLRQMLVELVA